MSHLPWGQEIVPLGIHVEPLTGGPSEHTPMGPHPKEGRPEGTERARSWPPVARVQRAGWGLTRHPQESRRAGCGAAAGVPACLSAPVSTKRQGPTVWAGGGSWPCPRAASGPRTLLPALRLWCSRTPWVGDSVRTGPHRAPLCWPTHSTGGAQDLGAGWPQWPPRPPAETPPLRTKVSAQSLQEPP